MTGRKIKLEDRWKYRVAPAPKRRVELAPTEEAAPAPAPAPPEEVAPAPAPAPAPAYAPAPVVDEERARLDQARIDKWIRDRVVAEVPGLCWRCRRPFIVGQKFIDVRGDEVVVRFHAQCESEWRRVQEAAARRSLGLGLAGSIHET